MKYMIKRWSGDHNTRFLTNFGSFRYKSELQGGEEFVMFDAYNNAHKAVSKFQKEARQAAKDLKKSLGHKAKTFHIDSDFIFGIKEV